MGTFIIYFIILLMLGAVAPYLLFRTKNAKIKRILFPLLVILVGSWVLGFIWFLGFPRKVLFIATVSVALVSFLNWRSFKFCNACGSTVRGESFSTPKQCSSCGAEFSDR